MPTFTVGTGTRKTRKGRRYMGWAAFEAAFVAQDKQAKEARRYTLPMNGSGEARAAPQGRFAPWAEAQGLLIFFGWFLSELPSTRLRPGKLRPPRDIVERKMPPFPVRTGTQKTRKGRRYMGRDRRSARLRQNLREILRYAQNDNARRKKPPPAQNSKRGSSLRSE